MGVGACVSFQHDSLERQKGIKNEKQIIKGCSTKETSSEIGD